MATLNIGVLAMQGAFREHVAMLNKIECVSATEVRTKEQLEAVDGLVLPGGESTAIGLMAERCGILETLRHVVLEKKIPVFATCAGMIMLGNKAVHLKDGGQPLIGGLDVVVDRNHFGTQLNSFETDIEIEEPILQGEQKCRGLFIRAPAIVEVSPNPDAPDVKVLARLTQETMERVNASKVGESIQAGECIVAAKQGHLMVTAFHPEITSDMRWHEYFVEMVKENKSS